MEIFFGSADECSRYRCVAINCAPSIRRRIVSGRPRPGRGGVAATHSWRSVVRGTLFKSCDMFTLGVAIAAYSSGASRPAALGRSAPTVGKFQFPRHLPLTDRCYRPKPVGHEARSRTFHVCSERRVRTTLAERHAPLHSNLGASSFVTLPCLWAKRRRDVKVAA